jgi:hypothetical protein
MIAAKKMRPQKGCHWRGDCAKRRVGVGVEMEAGWG